MEDRTDGRALGQPLQRGAELCGIGGVGLCIDLDQRAVQAQHLQPCLLGGSGASACQQDDIAHALLLQPVRQRQSHLPQSAHDNASALG